MKRITLLLSLMMISSFLPHTEAAPIKLHNYVDDTGEYNSIRSQHLINANLILALSGTNWEFPLWDVEKGNFTAIDTGNTILGTLENTSRALFKLRRNNHDTPAPVPEPATMIFLGTGLIGLAGYMKAKKRSSN